MKEPIKTFSWYLQAVFPFLALLVVPVVAVGTGFWVLTAIPVGFLFGFLVQKGDLCGASAFGEVLMMKSWRKVWGFWVWIVVGMVGLAILDLAGLAKLSPKPFTYVSYVVGGLLFGAGSVLAGGCVSGSLFKAGMGHLNSIVALFTIGMGVSAVEHGPLKGWVEHCNKEYLITSASGGPITLSSLTGLPFWALAFGIALITVIGAFLAGRKTASGQAGVVSRPEDATFGYWLKKRTWQPWQAGLALGILTMLSLLSSAPTGRNYPLGVTHGVMHVQLLITDSNLKHVWKKPPAPPTAAPTNAPTMQEGLPSASGTSGAASQSLGSAAIPASRAASSLQSPAVAGPTAMPVAPPAETPIKPKPVVWWLVLEILSLMAGSWVAASLSRDARLYPKPPDQLLVALFGGFLVGVGAAFAGGCFIGNMTSGWALMSIGNVLFGVCAILANWATTHFYLMGGSLFGSGDEE